ncbi:hypothetical protein P4114_22840 [Pseudomonas aeruginosa]|nr:hypothetical protein [Pseudomonas aeruginosa]
MRALALDNRSGSIGSKGAVDIDVSRLENDDGDLLSEGRLKRLPSERTVSGDGSRPG